MAQTRRNISKVDPVWDQIQQEAEDAVRDEPLIGGFVHACILHHRTLEKALSYRISAKLASNEMSMAILREIADQAYDESPALVDSARADLVAVFERDPASHRLLQPILYFKGYQAMQAYRVGHWLVYLGPQRKRRILSLDPIALLVGLSCRSYFFVTYPRPQPNRPDSVYFSFFTPTKVNSKGVFPSSIISSFDSMYSIVLRLVD